MGDVWQPVDRDDEDIKVFSSDVPLAENASWGCLVCRNKMK